MVCSGVTGSLFSRVILPFAIIKEPNRVVLAMSEAWLPLLLVSQTGTVLCFVVWNCGFRYVMLFGRLSLSRTTEGLMLCCLSVCLSVCVYL